MVFWKRKPNADKRQQAQEHVEQARRIWTKLVEIEEAVGEPIPPLPSTAFSMPLTDLGWYLRHRLLCEPPRPYLDLPLLRALDLNLRGMALNRDVWPELSVIRLSFLFYHQVLSIALTPEPGLSDEEAQIASSRIGALFRSFQSVPVESRIQVVKSVAKVLASTDLQMPYGTGSVKVSAAPADLPQIGADVAAAILWHLRQRLGVDLQGALESMARVELRRRPDLAQSMTRLLRTDSGN